MLTKKYFCVIFILVIYVAMIKTVFFEGLVESARLVKAHSE